MTKSLFRNCIAGLSAILFATSCNHKDLEYDTRLNTLVDVVFDWQYALDADPASMGLYFYDQNDGKEIRYNFDNKHGGTIRIPFSNYNAVCLNNDNSDWAVFTYEESISDFEVSTTDATFLTASGIAAHAIPRTAEEASERLANTPGMLYSSRLDDIAIPYSTKHKTITLYPRECVCHYIVDVLDVSNISSLGNSKVDATLSGMAEGFKAGAAEAHDTPATMPFVLSSNIEEGSLHAEFLTFGETPHTTRPHLLSLYMLASDGSKWHYTFDVSQQIYSATDPRHVHIIVRGIDLPSPLNGSGGFIPDVNDWQSIYIDIPMQV